jgi:hypothetical protein
MSTQRTALLVEEATTSSGLDGVPEGQSATREDAPVSSRAIDDFVPVTYNYSFFHLIFALASMYIAMLMTGWGSQVRMYSDDCMPLKGRRGMGQVRRGIMQECHNGFLGQPVTEAADHVQFLHPRFVRNVPSYIGAREGSH